MRSTLEVARWSDTVFELRYRVTGEPTTDVTETVAGQLSGGVLHVTYDLVGTLWGAPVDAHAAGMLAP